MFLVKCLPFVGTAVTAAEAVVALREGNNKKFFSKLLQTGVGASMDAAFLMSGGISSLATAPLKGAAMNIIVQTTANVALRAATEYVVDQANDNGDEEHHSTSNTDEEGDSSNDSSAGDYNSGTIKSSTNNYTTNSDGGGNDPPKEYSKLPKEHELDEIDFESEEEESDDDFGIAMQSLTICLIGQFYSIR